MALQKIDFTPGIASRTDTAKGTTDEVNDTITRKMSGSFLLAVLLSSFISATDSRHNNLIRASNYSKIEKGVTYGSAAQQQVVLDIHPLDVLALKFN